MITLETQDGYSFSFPKMFLNYKFIKKVGCGSTCAVILVEDQTTKERYSAKIIPKEQNKQDKSFQQTKTEIEILKTLNHPNIIKIHDSFEIQTEEGNEFMIIIAEYCENGTLIDYVIESKHQNDQIIKKILQEFTSSVRYLHDKGISHGDIKPDNILLDSKLRPKLCDFGFCHTKIIEDEDMKIGTLYYAAPELFKCGKFNSLKADIYAIGITLYCSMEIHFPFKEGDQDCIIRQIVSGKLCIGKEIDEKLRRLVVKCTDLNPNKRPTIEEVIKDEYFTGKQNENEKEIHTKIINENIDNSKGIDIDKFDIEYEFEKEIEEIYDFCFFNKYKKHKYPKRKPNKKIKKTKKWKEDKNKYRVELML